MEKCGIDVSLHQGVIDWNEVKNTEKIDFAIIQAGYGRLATQKDPQFERNFTECERLGIDKGLYWYSYATTPEEAKLEAAACLEVIKGKKFEYPLFFDIEEKRQCLGMGMVTAIVKAFCEAIEAAGYWVGIYSYKYFLESYIDKATRSRYAVWLAHYTSATSYADPYGMWQHSVAGDPDKDIVGKGRVAGINSNCDLDYCYVDYPTAIKVKGLNGYPKSETVKTEQPKAAPEKQPDPDHTELTGTLTLSDSNTYDVKLIKK